MCRFPYLGYNIPEMKESGKKQYVRMYTHVDWYVVSHIYFVLQCLCLHKIYVYTYIHIHTYIHSRTHACILPTNISVLEILVVCVLPEGS